MAWSSLPPRAHVYVADNAVKDFVAPRALGWRTVEVSDIYADNEASQRLYTSLGFVRGEPTELGWRYTLTLAEDGDVG